jgi:CheY-like chemotaxis protein
VPSLLIVKDNQSNRRLIRSELEHEGCEICGEAEDGVQAIDSAKQLRPDLILLDAYLPRLGPKVPSVFKRALPKSRIVLFTLYDRAVSSTVAAAIGWTLCSAKQRTPAKVVRSRVKGSEINCQRPICAQR